ncbi:hypothetical protein CYMTET_42685 [Cymbomonas tetramitiformis]|uniref:Uncharacterized protein n=1 Tax=Cymbomonas tetramitiformis TaxID=36881 RepID=A0AAE0C5U0_9CHLO|nr:hypothetical protein CYMTET_42685 [Cymbomonas tetramitiformis]
MCAHDTEMQDFIDFILDGVGIYTLPNYEMVYQHTIKLSGVGKKKVKEFIFELLAEGVLPSIAGDIWSEGGVALLGILMYWLSDDGMIHERLLRCIPFSEVRHTADEIEKATKEALADFGIGEYTIGVNADAAPTITSDTVTAFVHGSVSDNASNIVAGWNDFDGHECAGHTLALCVKKYLESPKVNTVFKKLRGMTTHFNHSVIGGKLLEECQTTHGRDTTKPPKDNDTRTGWGGAYKQCSWYYDQQPAVQMYDVENPRKASTAVANPDGSVYGDHKLIDLEWDIVRDSSFVLYFPYVVVQRLQATHTPTSNLVMPFVSFLAYKLHDDTPLVISGVRREHIDQHVAAARRNLYKDVSKRYFNDLMECKLEDLAVATGLDPRYKSFKFKFVEKWNRGNFTPSVGQKWLRDAFYSDWSGDKSDAAEQRSAPTVHTSEVVEMEIFLDCCGNTAINTV